MMTLLTLNNISATLFGLLLLIAGWLLNQFMFRNKNGDWVAKAKEAETENKNLSKKIKNQDNQIKELKNKSASWKQEFQLANKEIQDLRKSNSSSFEEMQSELNAVKSELVKKESALTVSERANERTRKELDQLKEKYKNDLSDVKQWKSEKSSFAAELDATRNKLTKVNSIAVDYKSKFESQAEEIEKVNELNRELRALRAKAKKFEADCGYWEKKHYDAHHKLAKLEKEKEEWNNKLKEIEELRKGDEILKQNLVGQVQEYKTKFLDVSGKFRELSKN